MHEGPQGRLACRRSHELKRTCGERHKVASTERVSGLPFLCIARLEIPTEDIQVRMAGDGLENTQADPGVVCIRQARSPPRVSGRAIDAQVSTDLTQGYVRRLPCQVLALRVTPSTGEQIIRTLGRPPMDAFPLLPPPTKFLCESVIDGHLSRLLLPFDYPLR